MQLDGRSHHPILPQRPSAYIEPAGLGKSLPHFNRVARPPPLQPRREASLSTRYIRTSGGMPPPSRGARLSVFGPVDDEATSRDRAPVVASRFSCHWRHGAQVRNRRAPAGRGADTPSPRVAIPVPGAARTAGKCASLSCHGQARARFARQGEKSSCFKATEDRFLMPRDWPGRELRVSALESKQPEELSAVRESRMWLDCQEYVPTSTSPHC